MRIPTDTLPLMAGILLFVDSVSAATLTGSVIDEATSQPIAARIYVHDATGQPFHVKCEQGSAFPYDRRRSETSHEVHTTISAHPFHVDLPAGEYAVTVEKGKEYFAASHKVTLSDDRQTSITIRLKRWVDMSAQGWYSGETHVHREVVELPTLQLAEDVNVAFPLTAWVTDSEQSPATNNKNKRKVPPAECFHIDKTHVFWPVNTEYEIFTVRGTRHTLGAVFVLNHKTPLVMPAPPVGPIAQEARKQNAFLELDKHNWPWSIMLVPQMNVDLFELANNHMWRTNFLFSDWYPEYAGQYMNIEMLDGHFTERGWMNFGFETYYALLNCGFNMKPTAGTASGVHPVPFGFGRVYVHLQGHFSYDKWIEGLLAGQSFVTTGPMLTASVERDGEQSVKVSGLFESSTEPISIELIVNGRVENMFDLSPQRSSSGAFRIPFAARQSLGGTSWIAVRAFAKRTGGRVSFAHTAPVHIEVAGKPLRPTRLQRDYLVKRVADEIVRNRTVVSSEALREFEEARQQFESIEVAN